MPDVVEADLALARKHCPKRGLIGRVEHPSDCDSCVAIAKAIDDIEQERRRALQEAAKKLQAEGKPWTPDILAAVTMHGLITAKGNINKWSGMVRAAIDAAATLESPLIPDSPSCIQCGGPTELYGVFSTIEWNCKDEKNCGSYVLKSDRIGSSGTKEGV